MMQFYKRCAYLCVITLIALFSLNSSFAQWTNLNADFPNGLYILQSQQTMLDGKLYMFGGRYGNSFLANAWVLDVSQKGSQWTQIKAMPSPRAGGYAAAINGKIYIVAGFYGSGTSTINQTVVLEYDPATDEYTEKSEIINPVYQVAGAVVGKRIFVLNGLVGSSYLKQAQVYDVEKDAWEELTDTKYSAAYSTATAIGETIYLMGGYTGSAFSNSAYKGVVASNNEITWTKLPNIPVAMAAAASGNNGTNVFLAGGETSAGTVNSCYKFDIATNKWASSYMVPNPTEMNAVMPNNGEKLYLISGLGNSSTFEFSEGAPVALFNIDKSELNYMLKTGNEKTFTFTITNSGVVSLKGDISVSNNTSWLTTSSSSYEIEAGKSETFEVTANSSGMTAGDYQGTITVTSNDAKKASSTISVSMSLIDNPYKRIPVIEVFTSSTCPPCKPGNEMLHQVLGDFTSDQYTLIKFQEYFPGTGDPYTTSETIARGALYQVNNGIPFVAVDGKWIGNPNTTFNTEVISNAQDEVAVAQLTSSYNVNDKKVNISVDVESLVNLASDNIKLHVAIAEKETSKNKKTNNETAFYHVVKKMLPDVNGTAIAELKKGEKITKTFEFEFPGNYRLPKDGQNANIIKLDTEHSVEEFSDLEVITWLEDVGTGASFNSSQAQVVSSAKELPDNSGLSFIDIYPNPSAGMTNFSFKAEKNMDVTLELFDLAGNKVASIFSGTVTPGEYSKQFDTSVLPSGQYNMWLKTNDKFIGRTINVVK